MQINEFVTEQELDEGPLDFAKKVWSGVKGAKQGWSGAKAGYSQETGRQDIDKKANVAFRDWNQKIVSGNPVAGQSPEALKQYGSKVASYYFKAAGAMPEPKSMDPAGVKQYFKDIIGLNQAAYNGVLPTQQTQPQAQTTQAAPAQPQTPGSQNLPASTVAQPDMGDQDEPKSMQQRPGRDMGPVQTAYPRLSTATTTNAKSDTFPKDPNAPEAPSGAKQRPGRNMGPVQTAYPRLPNTGGQQVVDQNGQVIQLPYTSTTARAQKPANYSQSYGNYRPATYNVPTPAEPKTTGAYARNMPVTNQPTYNVPTGGVPNLNIPRPTATSQPPTTGIVPQTPQTRFPMTQSKKNKKPALEESQIDFAEMLWKQIK